MSKVYETVSVPARTEKRVTAHLCDRCGHEVKDPQGYAYRTFELRWEVGQYYPGDEPYPSDGFRLEDCCDVCAEVLRTLLRTNGFKLVDANGRDQTSGIPGIQPNPAGQQVRLPGWAGMDDFGGSDDP